jgi:hypothetical protein
LRTLAQLITAWAPRSVAAAARPQPASESATHPLLCFRPLHHPSPVSVACRRAPSLTACDSPGDVESLGHGLARAIARKGVVRMGPEEGGKRGDKGMQEESLGALEQVFEKLAGCLFAEACTACEKHRRKKLDIANPLHRCESKLTY